MRASRSAGASVPVTAATSIFLPSAPRRCSATYSAVGMNRQNTIGWWPSLTSSLTSLIAAWSFVSASPRKALRGLGEGEQPFALRAGAGVVVLVESAGRGVEALGPFVAGVIHHGESAELVGLLDGLGGEVVGAGAQRRRGGGGARAERAQQRERGPPAHALAAAVLLRRRGRSRGPIRSASSRTARMSLLSS